MRTSEIEASTRKTYLGYIGNHIKPVLGKIAVKRLVRCQCAHNLVQPPERSNLTESGAALPVPEADMDRRALSPIYRDTT